MVGIVKKLSLKTFEGNYKILILWLPEFLGKEGSLKSDISLNNVLKGKKKKKNAVSYAGHGIHLRFGQVGHTELNELQEELRPRGGHDCERIHER